MLVHKEDGISDVVFPLFLSQKSFKTWPRVPQQLLVIPVLPRRKRKAAMKEKEQ